MATIVVLKNKKTGEKKSMYTPDARDVLGGPDSEDWEFVRRLDRTARMVETGVAAEKAKGEDGAVEFHGDRILQEDALKAVSPKNPEKVELEENMSGDAKKDVPQAPRGERGGGKQEPAKKADDS